MNNNKLYVGNLSFDSTEDQIKTFFSDFGEITDIRLIKDFETGRSRGFAFITFADESDAQKCLDQEISLANRNLKISIAKERKPR